MNASRLTAAHRGVGRLAHSASASRTTRLLHLRPTATLKKKEDLMDKDALNPTSTEYSQTGGGDQGAAHEAEAFNPKNTDPDAQTHDASKKPKGDAQNPLNVSPANPAANPTKQDTEQGTSRGAAGKKQSHRSSPTKHG